jgi:hypothetical protein
MAVYAIPEDIERFLSANIESIDQLEVLRVLGEQPGTEWCAADLAGEVQTGEQALGAHLAALLSRGLVTSVGQGPDQRWRHGARTSELEGLVGRLLQVYRERPVTLIKMVYAGAGARLRAFADAFRVREGH